MPSYSELLTNIQNGENTENTPCNLPYNVLDKVTNANNYVDFFINRMVAMGKFGNLPEHIEHDMLMLTLLGPGHVGWIVHENKVWPLYGSFAPAPGIKYPSTPQGRPTGYLITNVALGISKTYTIGKDCVVMRVDPLSTGVLPVINRYAVLLAENDISLYNVDVLMRALFILSASEDPEAKAAGLFIQNLIDGKPSFLADPDFADKVTVSPGSSGSNQTIKGLIELHQYLKAGCWNDLSVQDNWNCKREYTSAPEAAMNESTMLPYPVLVERSINQSLDQVNRLFADYLPNGPITFELDSSWKYMQEEAENGAQADTSDPGVDDGGNMAGDGNTEPDPSVDKRNDDGGDA